MILEGLVSARESGQSLPRFQILWVVIQVPPQGSIQSLVLLILFYSICSLTLSFFLYPLLLISLFSFLSSSLSLSLSVYLSSSFTIFTYLYVLLVLFTWCTKLSLNSLSLSLSQTLLNTHTNTHTLSLSLFLLIYILMCLRFWLQKNASMTHSDVCKMPSSLHAADPLN